MENCRDSLSSKTDDWYSSDTVASTVLGSCNFCGIETSNPKFCSLSCSVKDQRRKQPWRIKYCEFCGKPFDARRDKGKKRFCNRNCSSIFNNLRRGKTERIVFPKKSLVEKWLAGEASGTVTTGLSSAIRIWLIEQAGYKCVECGWSGINPVSNKSTLTVEHIDGDAFNNQRENLKVLCPSCHSLTPTYGALNKNSTRKYRYKKHWVRSSTVEQ